VVAPLGVWLLLKEPQAPALAHVTAQFMSAPDGLLLTATLIATVAFTAREVGGEIAKRREVGSVGGAGTVKGK
jgi:hypothetical protein